MFEVLAVNAYFLKVTSNLSDRTVIFMLISKLGVGAGEGDKIFFKGNSKTVTSVEMPSKL